MNPWPSTIRLFLAAFEDASAPAMEAAWLPRLSGDERERWNRFAFPHSKLEFLAGRALLRSVLAAELGCDPARLRFGVSAKGKPGLLEPRGAELSFNLSHTRGAAILAIGPPGGLGVDIEPVESSRDHAALARRFFSPAENGQLDSLPEERRLRAFTSIWTLKEAYLKARGLGITIPLASFYVRLPAELGEPPGIGFIPGFGDDPGSWRLHLASPGPGWIAAAAFRPDEGEANEVQFGPVEPIHLL